MAVNGQPYQRTVEPRLLLSDFIRHEAGLTGTHVGCEHGVCGACTVLMDGTPVRSCLTFAITAERHGITTVEALSAPPSPGSNAADAVAALHPLQRAFRDAHALQCGYCTPGILMTAKAFLDDHPAPATVTEQQVREALSGNLCRCTGYQHIVDAVLAAAKNWTKAAS